jgi:hypothetical protein
MKHEMSFETQVHIPLSLTFIFLFVAHLTGYLEFDRQLVAVLLGFFTIYILLNTIKLIVSDICDIMIEAEREGNDE